MQLEKLLWFCWKTLFEQTLQKGSRLKNDTLISSIKLKGALRLIQTLIFLEVILFMVYLGVILRMVSLGII